MRNILIILVAALTLTGLTFLLSLTGLIEWSRYYVMVMAFLVFLTIVADQINLRSLEQDGRAVVIPYIISTILKLVFSSVFLIFFVREHMDFAKLIVFSFIAYYAVFSTLEIIIVNNRTKPKKF